MMSNVSTVDYFGRPISLHAKTRWVEHEPKIILAIQSLVCFVLDADQYGILFFNLYIKSHHLEYTNHLVGISLYAV